MNDDSSGLGFTKAILMNPQTAAARSLALTHTNVAVAKYAFKVKKFISVIQ